jgi:membrane protein
MGRGLIENISNTLGKEGADQVRQVVRSISGFSDSWYVIVFGFIFLLFVATTLFSEIKNSLNQLWQISVKDHPGLLFVLRARTKSFAAILLTGILFFADLFLESLEVVAGNYVDEIWNWGSIYFKSAVQQIASVIIVAAWFILLFRFLADGFCLLVAISVISMALLVHLYWYCYSFSIHLLFCIMVPVLLLFIQKRNNGQLCQVAKLIITGSKK